MKTEIIKIADDLRNGIIDTETAKTLLLFLFIVNKNKQFIVYFKYINRTDASLHEEVVYAQNYAEAFDKVCANHNYEIQCHTAKEVT
jgi:hypothetical protein